MAYRDHETNLAKKAEYREKNREKLREKAREYSAAHREECRERARRYAKPQTTEERRAWKRKYDARPEVKERNKEHARKFRLLYPAKAKQFIIQSRINAKARLDVIAGRPRPLTCEVCDSPPTKNGLVFDHCHEHGHFRGWLCHNCNVILGLAKDKASRLRKLADYLEQTQSPDWW